MVKILISLASLPLLTILLRSLSFPVSTTIILDAVGTVGGGVGAGGGALCFI